MTIKSTTLGSTLTTIFTSSTSVSTSTVTAFYLCNTGAGVANVNIHAVPSGGSATSSNLIYYQLSINPSATFVIDTARLILDKSDSLVGISTVANVVVGTVSYMGL